MARPWPELDRLAHSTAEILGVPMLLISTVEDQRLLVRAAHGVSDSLLERIGEGQVVCPLCQQVIAGGQPLLVQDTRRRIETLGHGALASLGIAAYAGVPIRIADGVCIGALAAIDHTPRAWQSRDMMILGAFGEAVSALVGQRQQARRLAQLETLAGLGEQVGRGLAGAGALEDGALRDELTGLLNRRGFLAMGDSSLARARRHQLPGLLFYVDVDGANGADQAASAVQLQDAAEVLRRSFADVDPIARLGGSTFAAFSVESEEQDRAVSLPRAWRIGMSVFNPTSPQTLHLLLREAARRMQGSTRRIGG